jgi:hypothetical protein
MMIRRINRQSTPPASQSTPRERLRQWAQTPTGCRTCDRVRAAVGAVLPKPKALPPVK